MFFLRHVYKNYFKILIELWPSPGLNEALSVNRAYISQFWVLYLAILQISQLQDINLQFWEEKSELWDIEKKGKKRFKRLKFSLNFYFYIGGNRT